MTRPHPHTFNTQQKNSITAQLQTLQQKKTRIAWLRFSIFIITGFGVYLLWFAWWLWPALTALTGIALLLAAVAVDANNNNAIANQERLLWIVKRELQVLEGNVSGMETGNEFFDATHAYANDLDIFGDHSLYQYLNRCTSEQGKALLAQQLLQPQSIQHIQQQQQAVHELQQHIPWLQQYQALGHEEKITNATERRITQWLQTTQQVFNNNWHWITLLYTIITLSCAGLYAAGYLPSATFSMLVFVFFIFALAQSKKVHTTYLLLSRMVKEVNTLQKQLQWLEQAQFNSPYLQQLQASLQDDKQQGAAAAIKQLKKILDRFDVRLNVFAFYFLNTFLLWDVRQMLALQQWRQQHGNNIQQWLQVLAQTEVSISITTLAFNRPEWCYPTITPQPFNIQAINMGHPLLPADKRVDNTFNMQGVAQIALVTGSNMGGKSTFLRSIGVNTVLALMGSPVCATAFTVAHVRLMSSMRIADNLAESTSTFYAELKKLQTIIQAVNNHEPVFILLDEILRGTNSLDRHTGSKALIRQLIQQQAVAIIATHDVELAALETTYPNALHNYHFDVQVANNELFFDYKLKNGVCQSLNASILMKKIGIEL